MPATSLIILDDFYDDPDKVRNTALNLQYNKKPGATYPGVEAINEKLNWKKVWNQLKDHIPEAVTYKSSMKTTFVQGKFRVALEKDNANRIDKVHVDIQRWSGVAYLTKNEDCKEGVILYKHKPTGSIVWPEEWFIDKYSKWFKLDEKKFKEKVFQFFNNPRQFEKIGMIPMRYNRVILFMAQVFHGTGRCFGNKPANGRLTQHFEFYSKGNE